MEIPFGKYEGRDLSEMRYEDLPYMHWMQKITRSKRFRYELECRILDLEQELDDLARYYTCDAMEEYGQH